MSKDSPKGVGKGKHKDREYDGPESVFGIPWEGERQADGTTVPPDDYPNMEEIRPILQARKGKRG